MLRRYIFHSDSAFDLQQFYYRDAHCTQPAYAIEARGRISIQSQSWLVPGGTEAEYELSLVTIRPYSNVVARKLQRSFSRTCPSLVRGAWRENEAYIVYQLTPPQPRSRRSASPRDYDVSLPINNYDDVIDDMYDDSVARFDDAYDDDEDEDYADDDYEYDDDVMIDQDCRSTLFIVFHELQLVRVERERRHNGGRRTLWLGDIHSDYTKRDSYRPTSYQDALVSAQVCIHVHVRSIRSLLALFTFELK